MFAITEEGKVVVQLAEVLAGVSILRNGKLDTITSLITSIIEEAEKKHPSLTQPPQPVYGDEID